MTMANGTNHSEERLTLEGRLSEMAQLPEWVERLASRYSIPDDVRFAMDLCLEEALANVVMHGYGGDTDRCMIVRFRTPRQGYFEIVVDDEAPRYNPLDPPELPAIGPDEPIRVGGQGLRLLRRFTDEIEYEAVPTGNRLRMGFRVDGVAAHQK